MGDVHDGFVLEKILAKTAATVVGRTKYRMPFMTARG
jgi:hypothetical protein